MGVSLALQSKRTRVAVYETEALILRSYSLADADKIAVFLTRGFGIIKGVAKGAKKLTSRFGSTLEPFTAVDLTYFLKDDHDLASIREIELRRSLFNTSTRPRSSRPYPISANS